MKAVRRVGCGFGGLSAVYAGYYMMLYLTRWEWQRALISGVLLLVIKVFLATVIPLTRFSRLEQRLDQSDACVEEVRQRLEQPRETAPNRFRWMHSADLTELNGMHWTFVFVPILMVAGAALSGIAMVVQKVASATARPGAERRLAGRLAVLAAPPVTGTARLEGRPALAPACPGRRWLAVAAPGRTCLPHRARNTVPCTPGGVASVEFDDQLVGPGA